MEKICLNRDWRLHEAPLSFDRTALPRVLALPDGWLSCDIPCDVHVPLQEAGIIRDVSKADYCYGAEWTQERSWWFVKEFDAPTSAAEADVIELVLESLDAHADVYLNGEWLGTHISAHYPFVRGVKGRIRPGKNALAVRMTTGLETVSDEDLAVINWACCTEAGNGYPERGDKRRGCVRKPQYVVGWDWAPKAVTCGIVKDVYLRCWNKVALRDVSAAVTAIEGGRAHVRVTLEADQLHPYSTLDGDARVRFTLDGQTAEFEKKDVLLTSGLNYIDFDVTIENARLWWPNGYGEQPLYTVEAEIECGGVTEKYPPFRFGMRRVELDVSRATDGKNRNFCLIVNGVRIFCKGGDWIPCDSIYARVTDEKLRTLVEEARNANFNMLRVWGGGVYEREPFFDACDRCGILLWHDFMFGCSAYPDHLEDFLRECEKEMDYQTRRLRNHACLGIWCGSNEGHMIYNPEQNPAWGLKDFGYEKQYGLYTSNETGRRIVRRNCPEIPYWNSSPYGGRLPTDGDCGDTHNWGEYMMNPDMARRIEPMGYDQIWSRFVTEYGYPGPCPEASLKEVFDGRPIDRTSRVWRLHNNTFEKDTVLAGIGKHYLDDPSGLSLEDYILYAGMVQGLMLGYSLEAIRFKEDCGGGLFWMYNDTWCEVGWTIIDYYLRRKISYYGVKRAFAPVKLTLRKVDGKAVLQGCNDTPEDIMLPVRWGLVPLDGAPGVFAEDTFFLPARSRTRLARFDLPEADYTRCLFAVLPQGGACEPAVLRQYDTKLLRCAGAQPRVLSCEMEGGVTRVTLTADAYIHGVYLPTDARMSDNYFDLLPGQVKAVAIEGDVSGLRWKTVR